MLSKEQKKALEDKLGKLGLEKVCPRPYEGTFAIIPPAYVMAEDVTNRSSASWKKAEHIIFDSVQPEKGIGFLPHWRRFFNSNPDGVYSTQCLYIPISGGKYVKYDAQGVKIAEGSIDQLIKSAEVENG